MSLQNETPTHSTPRKAGSAVLLAALFPTVFACSADTPTDGVEQTVADAATGPFPRSTDPTGCVIEQLTSADYDEYQVKSASADGRWLSMAASIEGAAEDDSVHTVYEMDLVTGETTDLSHILQNSGPYSSDNRFVVVAQMTDTGKTDIFEYERATGELQPVASHENWDWLPSYSPDGRFIVFNSYRVDGQSDIHLFEKASGTLTRLTKGPGYDAHAQFSSDGQQIAYHNQRGERAEGGYIFDLMVYDMDSGQPTRLTDGDHEESYPAWAPDDRHIVFSSDVAGDHGKLNLYVLDTADKGISRLTDGDWKDSYAFWTHDGRYIYFNSDRAGVTNIYRMLMDGVECVRVG